MLENAGRGVIAGNDNMGKRLVVAQQNIEARPQPLDQIGFQQKRLDLGAGHDEFHRDGLAHHPSDAVRVETALRVVGDALLQAARLADIEHVAGGIHHAVDAGRVGQPLDQRLDDIGAGLAVGIACLGAPVYRGEGHVRALKRSGLDDDVVVLVNVAARQIAGYVLGRRVLLRDRRHPGRSCAHSTMPVTSGVSQARCCPPSSAINWPVIERVCHR